ncbi:MAG: dTDP-4-dehydrorhamnose 3,5-epimerase family protein [Gammaproteobacteria bacterium]|nr:dTDP-4-dehydrorhamnose 3,5-epimerase family protein [Gammaproteobacteria bacterium]
MTLAITETPLIGVFVVETTVAGDHRGSFARLFCNEELEPVFGPRRIVQINHSRTARTGAVRGMHFQRSPHAEMKLIRCIRGRAWDVAVDLRAGSATFLQWHAQELSPGNARMMVIPEGCAHGFQVLEPDTELMYLHSAAYHPVSEGGVRHDDPRLAIQWPLPVVDLSARDCNHPLITATFPGL